MRFKILAIGIGIEANKDHLVPNRHHQIIISINLILFVLGNMRIFVRLHR